MAKVTAEHTFSAPLLREHIGKYQGGSKAVARDTGISWRTVRAHRDGQMCVKDFQLIAYMRVLGARFTNDVLHEIGFGGARKLAAADCPHRVLAKTNRASAVLADALSDNGRVDHDEAHKVDAALADAGIPVTFRKPERVAA